MIVRCSSLPLIMRCRAAAERPELLIHQTSGAAELGTDVHRHLARMVDGDDIDWEGIEDPETRGLVASGLRIWRALYLEGQPAMSELEMSSDVGGVRVTGTADVVIVGHSVATVLDWKSGRLDSDYLEQLLGYACLLMLDAPDIESVDTVTAWLRDQDIERHSFDRDDLAAWKARVARLGDPWDGQYEAGPHCGHCPRAHECPAVNALVRRDATALLGLDVDALEGGLATMSPDRILELSRQAKLVGQVAERVRDAVRAHVARSGAVVALDGLLMLATERRRVVDAAAAWPVLEARLSDEELAGCIEVRLSRVEDAVAAKAGKGRGAQAKRELTAALEAANAVTTKEITKLIERR